VGESTVRRLEPDPGTGRYDALYPAYYPRVLAYCARRVGRQDAPDLAAQVFEVAWRRLDDIPTGDAELPWLYGVAYRMVSHHWRGERRRLRLTSRLAATPPPPATELEAVVVRRREYDQVLQAAAGLREADQELLRLVLWEGLSHQQIADMKGSTPAAVRQRFHRVKRALLREFERVGGSVASVAEDGGAP
jgi:RNA polymerase sigma-70 factor, ECF subfamily